MDDQYLKDLNIRIYECEKLINYYHYEVIKTEETLLKTEKMFGMANPLMQIQLYICKKYLYDFENEMVALKHTKDLYTSDEAGL